MTLLVNQVIDFDHGLWKIDHLKNFLTAKDFATISAMPIGDPNAADHLIWPLVKKGEYSVSSGYKCNAPIIKRDLSRCSSSHTIEPKLWKTIWSLIAPPKILNFL